MVISDLKKEIDKYEEEYRILRSKGFDNVERPRQTVSSDSSKYALILVIFLEQESVLEKCEGSWKFLSSLHRETASNNNFVARKNGREIRCKRSKNRHNLYLNHFSSSKPLEGVGKSGKKGSEA
jgi:hypothetical protein